MGYSMKTLWRIVIFYTTESVWRDQLEAISAILFIETRIQLYTNFNLRFTSSYQDVSYWLWGIAPSRTVTTMNWANYREVSKRELF